MEGALVLEMPFVPRLLRVRPEAARKTDRFGRFPLHLAIERQEAEIVVLSLLRAHPEHARHKDRDGFLPLHLALKREAPETVVIALLRAHPEGSRHADQSISRHPAIRRDRKKGSALSCSPMFQV